MKLLSALSILTLSSCSLPDINLWNERNTAKSVRMPVEVITKVIVHGSLVSLVRNPFSSTKKGLWVMKSRAEVVVSKLVEINTVDPQYRSSHSIEELLDKMNMPEPVGGNIDYLIDGKTFFTALEKSIAKAEETIDVRVYIYDNDEVAVEVSNQLKARSKEVRCRVLMDQFGSLNNWWAQPDYASKSFKPPSSMPHFLRKNSKVQVRQSRNPWLIADHSKSIIIDQKEAYLGGMNIGSQYRYDWHDMMFRVTGPAVIAIQNDFNKAWRIQGGLGDWGYPLLRKKHYRKEIKSSEISLRILKTAPGRKEILEATLAAIRMAKKRVYIQNSYFTTDALATELVRAQKRGVDVRMVFPFDNDSALLGQSNLGFAKQLIDSGASVYSYPKFTHIKALVVDDWVCIGSANYDAFSMHINNETNIAFTDKKQAEKLVNDLFRKDFSISKKLTKKDSKDWAHPTLEILIDQL